MPYNVFTADLDVDHEEQHPGYAVGGTILAEHLPMGDLGATLYVLPPGNANAPYHWHHNVEEALLVLAGHPTLRSPDGDSRLEPGDFVSFPRGASGAHKVTNQTEEPVRYMIISTKPPSDIVEYPDSSKVGFGSRGQSWRILTDAPSRGYWDDE